MNKTIGINLGSHTITVYCEGKGIILREPNAVAINTIDRTTVAIGNEAITVYNRTPGAIELMTHIYQGNVSDYGRMAAVMKEVIRNVGIRRPNVIFTVHGGLESSDIGAIASMLNEAGCGKLFIIDQPSANAIGCSLDLNDKRYAMICDIGAANTEIGIIHGCVTKLAKTLPYGCNKLDTAIASYVKQEYSAIITEDTAKAIRETVGSVDESYNVGSYTFKGRDSVTGLPLELEISSQQTREAMKRFADYLVANLRAILKAIPENVVEDIKQRGIILTGGGALDGGLRALIEKELGICVEVADAASECTVTGLGKVIENRDVFGPLLHPIEEE